MTFIKVLPVLGLTIIICTKLINNNNSHFTVAVFYIYIFNKKYLILDILQILFKMFQTTENVSEPRVQNHFSQQKNLLLSLFL